MKTGRTSDLDREVQRLMEDPRFAERIASRVQRSAAGKTRLRAGAALAAAAGIVFMISAALLREEASPPGLHHDSSALVAAQEISEIPWQDTDSVISTALASR